MNELTANLKISYGVSTSDVPRLRHFYAQHFRLDHPLLSDPLSDWYFGDQAGSQRNTGMRRTIVLASDSGRIVGHLGVVPVRLRVQGKLFGAAWCTNLLVIPEYARRGLGSSMINEALSRHDLIMSAGSTNAGLALHRQNGNFLLGALKRYLRILSAAGARNLILSHSSGAGQLLHHAEQQSVQLTTDKRRVAGPFSYKFPLGYRELWQAFIRHHPVVVERSAAHMNWRFGANPDLRYQYIMVYNDDSALAGLLVFRVDHVEWQSRMTVIRIMDMIAYDNAVGIMLHALESYARSIHAVMIEFYCTSSIFDEWFMLYGYVSSPHPLISELARLYHPIRQANPIGIHFSYKIHLGSDVPPSTLQSAANWYVTLADSDLDRIQR